jgi:molybdopterin synthase catalytic subunit
METKYLITGPITNKEIVLVMNTLGENQDSGAHSVFFGQVRADVIDGKRVAAIEYSAYNDMVIGETEKIKGIIFSTYKDVKSIEILHSTGTVKVGELSLLVLISSGHRHEAIEACKDAVELIKEKLPVWKKEIFEDHTYNWKQNTSDYTGS